MMPCPRERTLVRFVDEDLPADQTQRLTEHVSECAVCRRQDEALRTLIADVRLDGDVDCDVEAHVRSVMGRLVDGSPGADERVGWTAPPWGRWLAGSIAAGSLCAATLAAHHLARPLPSDDAWQARGALAPATIGRDVGVQAYALQGGLVPLASGVTIQGTTPLTAGFRNVGHAPAFLLLFVVDAGGAVHWISPPYRSAQDDPISTRLAPTPGEHLLGTTAVFDDLAAGPLRVVTVITPSAAHVSDVEALGNDLSARRIAARLAGAEVRETLLQVRDAHGESP